jgi:hypothetical protein
VHKICEYESGWFGFMVILKCNVWSFVMFSITAFYFKVRCANVFQASDFITVRIPHRMSLCASLCFHSQGCKNPRCHVAIASKCCIVAPNIRGSQLMTFFRVVILATGILSWSPDFTKILCNFLHSSSLFICCPIVKMLYSQSN